MSNNKGTPILQPPTTESSIDISIPGTSAPSDEQIAALVVESAPLAGPTMAPPAAAALAEEAVTGTWQNNVKIDALWCIDETRNAWMRVVGVGWKKIYNGRDGAFTALVTLASQARQTGHAVNIREEPDGMIYEIYLW
ncbi:hypothetical protein [Actinocrispum sp. NPDC049592]|uniref:hypothetical protein n=1 Tax=Actinocrispum sp. NPDC049592 TaxID=3154835 RepID=UPI0034434EB4